VHRSQHTLSQLTPTTPTPGAPGCRARPPPRNRMAAAMTQRSAVCGSPDMTHARREDRKQPPLVGPCGVPCTRAARNRFSRASCTHPGIPFLVANKVARQYNEAVLGCHSRGNRLRERGRLCDTSSSAAQSRPVAIAHSQDAPTRQRARDAQCAVLCEFAGARERSRRSCCARGCAHTRVACCSCWHSFATASLVGAARRRAQRLDVSRATLLECHCRAAAALDTPVFAPLRRAISLATRRH